MAGKQVERTVLQRMFMCCPWCVQGKSHLLACLPGSAVHCSFVGAYSCVVIVSWICCSCRTLYCWQSLLWCFWTGSWLLCLWTKAGSIKLFELVTCQPVEASRPSSSFIWNLWMGNIYTCDRCLHMMSQRKCACITPQLCIETQQSMQATLVH